MVPKPSEEDTSSEEGYLQRLYVDVYMVPMPRPGPDRVRNDGGKEAVEVEEEEDC